MAERNITSARAMSRERVEIIDGRHSELSDMPRSERRRLERVDNQNSGEIHALMDWVFAGHLYMHVRSSINPKEEYLSGLFSKNIW